MRNLADFFDVNTKLREARKHKRLTQLQLAELAGCSDKTLSAIERGDERGSDALRAKIASILDTPVEDLFPVNGTGESPGTRPFELPEGTARRLEELVRMLGYSSLNEAAAEAVRRFIGMEEERIIRLREVAPELAPKAAKRPVPPPHKERGS